MRIFIHRGSQTFGPYRLEDVLHGLGNGSLKPADMATYDGGGNQFVPLSAVPGVSQAPSSFSLIRLLQTPVGCWGGLMVAAAMFFVAGLFDDHTSKNQNSDSGDVRDTAGEHRALGPREFGYKLAEELLDRAEFDGGVTGIVFFAQACRRTNPTVRAYTAKEYSEFQAGTILAYQNHVIREYTTH